MDEWSVGRKETQGDDTNDDYDKSLFLFFLSDYKN